VFNKYIISGSLIESYEMEIPPFIPTNKPGGRVGKNNQSLDKDMSQLYKKKAVTQARNTLRRLIESNFHSAYLFLTLTFRPTTQLDVTNFDECYEQFKNFIKRINSMLHYKKYDSMKYICITEFQDTNQRGAIHYHVLCDLSSEISAYEVESIWGLGNVYYKRETCGYKTNSIISNYLSKGMNDERLDGRKKYFNSHGLIRPTTYIADDPIYVSELLNQPNNTCLKSESYRSMHTGNTQITEYYVQNKEEILNHVKKIR